jgi:hypothetical protein
VYICHGSQSGRVQYEEIKNQKYDEHGNIEFGIRFECTFFGHKTLSGFSDSIHAALQQPKNALGHPPTAQFLLSSFNSDMSRRFCSSDKHEHS